MIVKNAFIKSEQQIQNQWSLHTKGKGEPSWCVQVAALMSSSIHNQGTVPALFLGEGLYLLVTAFVFSPSTGHFAHVANILFFLLIMP